jgi:hypothetical protein
VREIVIIPTYKRSDMLYVCLESIRATEPTIQIDVFPDRGTDEVAICNRFNAVHHLTWQHSYHGNSANMLEALNWAYKQKPDNVFVIEDDAIVDPSFFSWCRFALADKTIFAACGWTYSPDAMPPSDGPDIKIPWYLSVATAIPFRSLYGIVQHARPEYYGNMRAYLDKAYPASHRRGSMHYEQDGLTLRVCESESKMCAWPRRPRATHVGWRGYHMPEGKELKGSLEDRVKIIKLLMKNPAMLKTMLNGGIPPEIMYCANCKTPLLSTNSEAMVICVACFHALHPEKPRTSFSHYYLPALFSREYKESQRV